MLKEIHKIEFEMTLLSGMHITGSDDTFDIGGPDSQVIKNPLSGEPYIPGSSLKGKLRSLLEFRYGEIGKDSLGKDNIVFKKEYDICKSLFDGSVCEVSVTRGIFRDLVLTEQSKKDLELALGEGVFTEIKAENTINKLQGKAANPRFIERVPAGVTFTGCIDVMEFEGDDYKKMLSYLKESFQLLEENYIGGSGTRGYGRVKIKVVKEG